MAKFRHNYSNRPQRKAEVLDPKSKVEKAGVKSASKIITDMMLTGGRFSVPPSHMYDNQGRLSDDEIPLNPTRRVGYDLAEATQDKLRADSRIAEALNAKKRSIASEKAKKEASSEASKNAPKSE